MSTWLYYVDVTFKNNSKKTFCFEDWFQVDLFRRWLIEDDFQSCKDFKYWTAQKIQYYDTAQGAVLYMKQELEQLKKDKEIHSK